MVEGTGFENQHWGNSIESSNLSVSAFARHSFSDGGIRSQKHVGLRRTQSAKHMKTFIKNILLIGLVVFLAQQFRPEIETAISNLRYQYFPCTQTTYYSIGTFDQRFGLSQDDLKKYLKEVGFSNKKHLKRIKIFNSPVVQRSN